MMKLSAAGQQLTAIETETLTSGSERFYRALFTFDEVWDGMQRTAVFRTCFKTVSVLLDDTGDCRVPWEALTYGGVPLEVSVFGVLGGEVVLTTNYTDVGTITEGADRKAAAGRTPTPTVYEELLRRMDDTVSREEIGAPGGVAPLDGDGRLPADHLTRSAILEAITNTEMEELLK